VILEFARRREDGVGTNLDGAPAPPFWIYLLSSLELISPCVLGDVSSEILRGLALWEKPTILVPGDEPPAQSRLILVGAGALPVTKLASLIQSKRPEQAIWLDASLEDEADITKDLRSRRTWWFLPEGIPRDSIRVNHALHSLDRNREAAVAVRIPAQRQTGRKRNRALRIATRVLRRLHLELQSNHNGWGAFAEMVPGGEPRMQVSSQGTLFLGAAPSAPPAWLLQTARLSDVDLTRRSWSILPARGFRSQKVSFFFGEKPGDAEPEPLAIKMTQDPQFNDRLLNEHCALSILGMRKDFPEEMIPRPLFAGTHRGLAVIGQTKLAGDPFASRSSGEADCPIAARALAAVHDLAITSAHPASGLDHAEAIQALLRKLENIYRPGTEILQCATNAVQELARLERVPTVFLHGDPEPQNMIVGTGGRIALLDWENAELDGPPLWDHYSFFIAYARFSLERSGIRPTPHSIARRLLFPSPWSDWMVRSTASLTARLQVPAAAVEPLLISHAAVMAVRESWRLSPLRLNRGTWIRWMGEIVRNRDRSPALAALRLAGSPSKSS
jgi:hypothetical protein